MIDVLFSLSLVVFLASSFFGFTKFVNQTFFGTNAAKEVISAKKGLFDSLRKKISLSGFTTQNLPTMGFDRAGSGNH